MTTAAHDGFGRLKQTTLPSGAYSTEDYTACASGCSRWAYAVTTSLYKSNNSLSGREIRYVDRYGRTYEQDTERLGGQYARTITQYNALGQVEKRSAPYYSGDDPYWTSYDYDGLGRVSAVVVPTASGTAATTATYNGYTATVSGPGGYTEAVTKNPLGQVTQVIDASGGASTYVYAPFAELTQVNGADQATTTLQYDAAGHRIQLGGPDRGTESFQFNSLGEPVSETNARGQAIAMFHDALGRMTKRTFPNPGGSGDETQHWHYASTGSGAGQLSSESDDVTGFSRALTYDSDGQLSVVSETFSGVPEDLSLGHDDLGRVSSVTYPVSVGGVPRKVNYSYDGSGNLSKVSSANDGTVYWQPRSGAGFPAMNAWGQMESYVLGGALDVERRHAAATGAVTSIASGPNGTGSVLHLTTGYNASGSRLTLNDLNAGLDQSYQYDSLQRLKKVTRTASGGNSSSSFSYYAAGQFNQGPAGSYSYGSFPKHSPSSTTQGGTTTGYSYDAAGDRTAARLPQVTWDALGKARSVTPQQGANPIDLTYGPDGGLVNNTGAECGRYLGAWLKWQDTNDWSARIIVQGRAIAVIKESGGSVSTSYLLQGPLGSTQAVATGGGSLTQRIAYGAWGSFVHPDTGTGTPNVSAIAQATTVTYTGHELIAGTGLINMGARLYDPATGLFMSPDPTVAHPFDTQDLNQYAYVRDNPMTFTDPFGLNPPCYSASPEAACDLPQMIVDVCPKGTVGVPPNCTSYSALQGAYEQLFEFFTGTGESNFGPAVHRPRLRLSIKAPKLCVGLARVLKNTGNLVQGQPGAQTGSFVGVYEQLGTAAIAPEQFIGGHSALDPHIFDISGTFTGNNGASIGVGSFTGVTDVIGGTKGSVKVNGKFPDIPVRIALMEKFPDRFLAELIGGPDLGKNALAIINLPAGLTPTSESGLSCISLAPSSSGGGGS